MPSTTAATRPVVPDHLDVAFGLRAVQRRDQPLRLIDQMRLDVDQPVALDPGIEIPLRPAERLAVHQLVDVMAGGLLDRRLGPPGLEGAEQLRLPHERAAQARQHHMPAGHDVHRQRPAGRGRGGEMAQRRRPGEPGLVGQDVETGLPQTADGGEFAIVASGQDHDLAAALLDQAVKRIRTEMAFQAPRRRRVGPGVEAFHQIDEGLALGSLGRMEMDLVCDPGIGRAKRERGVKVARIEKEQPVHAGRVVEIGPLSLGISRPAGYAGRDSPLLAGRPCSRREGAT